MGTTKICTLKFLNCGTRETIEVVLQPGGKRQDSYLVWFDGKEQDQRMGISKMLAILRKRMKRLL